MALKVTAVAASKAYEQIILQSLAFRREAIRRRADLTAATVSAQTVRSFMEFTRNQIINLGTLVDTPGLREYARAEVSNPAYDVVAEYTAMRSAMVDLRNAIVSLFPKNANGIALYETLNADATFTPRTFTSADVAPLLPFVDAVISATE